MERSWPTMAHAGRLDLHQLPGQAQAASGRVGSHNVSCGCPFSHVAAISLATKRCLDVDGPPGANADGPGPAKVRKDC